MDSFLLEKPAGTSFEDEVNRYQQLVVKPKHDEKTGYSFSFSLV
jgi:hypothetical protein